LHLLEGAQLDLVHTFRRHAQLGRQILERDWVVDEPARFEDAPLARTLNAPIGDDDEWLDTLRDEASDPETRLVEKEELDNRKKAVREALSALNSHSSRKQARWNERFAGLPATICAWRPAKRPADPVRRACAPCRHRTSSAQASRPRSLPYQLFVFFFTFIPGYQTTVQLRELRVAWFYARAGPAPTALSLMEWLHHNPGDALTICGQSLRVEARLGRTGVGPFDESYFVSFVIISTAALTARVGSQHVGISHPARSFSPKANRL
jgi:hypothetical protein